MKKNTMILINLLCFIGIFILTVLFFTNTTTAIMVNYLDYERWLYSAGFLLGYNVHFFLICAAIFFPVLFITSMVSLTSLISVVLIFIASFFFHDIALSIISGLLVVLSYWSHRSNISRIEHHQENMVPFGLYYWYKKKHAK